MIIILHIYTDGAYSSKTEIGGWGLAVYHNDELIHTDSNNATETTNNRMEMTAFLEALKYIEAHIEKNGYGTHYIYSDSAYIVNCFRDKWYVNWRRNGWKNSKKVPVKNPDLWQAMLYIYDKLSKRFNLINIVKVKAHSTNEGNVLADKLAVEARTI